MVFSVDISFAKKEKEDLEKNWDVIIIGGGIAGITAGIYDSRYGLKTLLISEEPGGLSNDASIVENYPGIIEKGPELGRKWVEHAEKMGTKILKNRVVDIKKIDNSFKVITQDGKEFESKAVIIATGSSKRKLNIPGEKEFLGKGVTYCATCDATLFKDKEVAVIGGGNSAFSDALILSEVAKKVYIIMRKDEPKAEKALVDTVLSKSNVELIKNKESLEFLGESKLEAIKLKDTVTDEISEIKVDGAFIAIGLVPNVDLAKKLGVKLDDYGLIDTDEAQRTNIKGVLAAGDVTNNSNHFDQFITAGAEGAIAANTAFKYVQYGDW